MYSLMPTADRGRSSSTSGPYLLGLGIQTAEEEPVRPSAGALILASLDGDPSCSGATNHMEKRFATGGTLSCATPIRNTPHASEGPHASGAHLRLTLWSAVVDDRLGTGERIDGLALGELSSALRRLVFMLGAPTGVASARPHNRSAPP